VSALSCPHCDTTVVADQAAVSAATVAAAVRNHQRFCGRPVALPDEAGANHPSKKPKQKTVPKPKPKPKRRPPVGELLTHEDKRIANAAAEVIAATTRLEQAWKADRAKDGLRAKRDRLARELAEVREQLGEPGDSPATQAQS